MKTLVFEIKESKFEGFLAAKKEAEEIGGGLSEIRMLSYGSRTFGYEVPDFVSDEEAREDLESILARDGFYKGSDYEF